MTPIRPRLLPGELNPSKLEVNLRTIERKHEIRIAMKISA